MLLPLNEKSLVERWTGDERILINRFPVEKRNTKTLFRTIFIDGTGVWLYLPVRQVLTTSSIGDIVHKNLEMGFTEIYFTLLNDCGGR